MQLSDRLVLGGMAVALALAVFAAWLLLASTDPGHVPGASTDPRLPIDSGASAEASVAGSLFVDIEGAVAEPGIQELPAGARVADAVVAAGGYSPDTDMAAVARQLNLAARLSDGQQIYVPSVHDPAGGSGTGGPASDASASAGLVNLNQATSEQLDALPGIGPVTVQKIVDSRSQQPFRTLDELVERKVLTASQLAKIRDRVTV